MAIPQNIVYFNGVPYISNVPTQQNIYSGAGPWNDDWANKGTINQYAGLTPNEMIQQKVISPITTTQNNLPLPLAANYTPSAQWLSQLNAAKNSQYGGLLSGGNPSLNVPVTRNASVLQSAQAPIQNSAALSARYLK